MHSTARYSSLNNIFSIALLSISSLYDKNLNLRIAIIYTVLDVVTYKAQLMKINSILLYIIINFVCVLISWFC